MHFAVTEEQRQLGDSLRRVLAEANDFDARRKRLQSNTPDRLALWPQFADLGVIAAAFDEAHGGFAGDARTMAVVMSALGESLTVEPYLANAVIAGRILQRSTAGAASLIEESIAGRHVCVLAHDAGSDPFAMPGVSVEQVDQTSILTGKLRCIQHADVADSFLVAAAHAGVTEIHHVPKDAKGLAVQTYRLMDAAGAGDVELRAVRLPRTARLGFDTSAEAVLHDALEWGILGLAAETAGIIGALNRATFGYLANRKQFGVPLATFQALQHRAADMFIAAEEVAAAVNYAIGALGTTSSAARSAAVCAAKVVADGAGRRVGHEAIQLHGGMGVSDELNVSHYARRLTTMRSALGSAETHKLRFASLQ